MCPPEKPNFILTKIAVQPNDLLRLQATFVMDKVKYVPFGNLRFQELELKLISKEFERAYEHTNKLQWKVKDFNDFGKSSNDTIYNLIKGAKYKPIIRYDTVLEMQNEKYETANISKIVYENYGEVKKIAIHKHFFLYN